MENGRKLRGHPTHEGTIVAGILNLSSIYHVWNATYYLHVNMEFRGELSFLLPLSVKIFFAETQKLFSLH